MRCVVEVCREVYRGERCVSRCVDVSFNIRRVRVRVG